MTRDVLPGMARPQRWPIALDHCFMRVCLDAVFGSPWTRSLARPAIRHMSEPQLEAAIEVAETLVARPDLLVRFNEDSLAGRRRSRRPAC